MLRYRNLAVCGILGAIILAFQNCGSMNTLTGTSSDASGEPGAGETSSVTVLGSNTSLPKISLNLLGQVTSFTPSALTNQWQTLPLAVPTLVNTATAQLVAMTNKVVLWAPSEGASAEFRGVFDPATQEWTTMSSANAPGTAFAGQFLLWTGAKLVVWGDQSIDSQGVVSPLSRGYAYDPQIDQWTALPAAPIADGLTNFSIVSSGTKLIFLKASSGQQSVALGQMFDLATGVWTTMAASAGLDLSVSAPALAASKSFLLFWGGISGTSAASYAGGEFNPATNNWQTMTVLPSGLGSKPNATPVSFWTGTQLALLGEGVAYTESSKTWSSLGAQVAGVNTQLANPVWTGSSAIVFDGANGEIYDAAANSFTELSAFPGAARENFLSAWTGSNYVVLGGNQRGSSAWLNDGYLYHPTTKTWSALAAIPIPFNSSSQIVWLNGTALLLTAGAAGSQAAVLY